MSSGTLTRPRDPDPAGAPEMSSLAAAVLLGAVVALGLALRLWGLDFGLPQDLRPDEVTFRFVVRDMVAAGDPDPRFYAYPGLPFHGFAAVLWAVHAGARLVGHPMGAATFPEMLADDVLLTRVQRSVSASLGTATILVTFLLGRRLRSRIAALLSALFVAVAPVHVRNSHFGTIDVPAAFGVAVGLLAIVRAWERPTGRRFAVAGAVAGLAAAVRYLPFLLAIPIAIAAIAAGRAEGRSWPGSILHSRGFLAALTLAGGFAAGAPYTFLAYDGFRAGMAQQSEQAFGLTISGLGAALGRHVQVSLAHGLGWPALVAAAVGLGAAARRPSPLAATCGAWTIAYLLLIGTASTDFTRYVVPLVPALAVLAAGGLLAAARLLPSGRARPAGLALAGLAVALVPLRDSVATDRALAAPSSFSLLDGWLARERPRSSRVVLTWPQAAELLPGLGPVADYDPDVLLHGPAPTWLVAFASPHPAIPPPAGVDDLRRLAASAEPVLEIRALDPARADACIFDRLDAFWLPYGGITAAERLGPDIRIWKIVPGPRPGESAPPPRPVPAVQAVSFRDRLAVTWSVAGSDGVLAWAVRHARAEDLGGPALPPPLHLPAGLRLHVFTVPAGRWWLSVSAVGAGGEGPPVPFGPVDVAGGR